MAEVRLGAVGLGAVYQLRHAVELAALPQVRTTWVADVDGARAQETAAAQACRWTADYGELVAADDVDAVLVCTPPPLHEEVVLAATRAGKHILCEKPLAPTVSACDRMIAAARTAGVKLMVAENWLFDPVMAFVKRCSADGTLGTLRHVRLLLGWPGPDLARFYDSPMPARNGSFLEDGIHMVAVTRALLGPPGRVVAQGRTLRPQRRCDGRTVTVRVEDDLCALVAFEGASAVMETTWNAGVGGLHFEVHGERGSIVIANHGWEALTAFGSVRGAGGLEQLAMPAFDVRAPASQPSYRIEDEAFLQAVLEDGPVPYPGEAGRADVEGLERVYAAASKDQGAD